MPSNPTNGDQYSGYPPGHNPYGQPYTGPGGYNPNDPYDPRVGNGALPPGIQGTQNRAYTRSVQDNELSGSRLTRMLQEDGDYVRMAKLGADERSNEQGQFMTSMASGAAHRAAIEAAAPFAMQEAGAFGTTASENMGALNARQLADMEYSSRQAGYDSQRAIAQGEQEGALQRQRENLAFSGEQQGLDRAFTQMQDYYNYNYDLGRMSEQGRLNIQDYAARTGIDAQAQRNIFLNDLYRAAMQDPELFTPEFIGGMYTNYFDAYNDVTSYLDDYLAEFWNDDWF